MIPSVGKEYEIMLNYSNMRCWYPIWKWRCCKRHIIIYRN